MFLSTSSILSFTVYLPESFGQVSLNIVREKIKIKYKERLL